MFHRNYFACWHYPRWCRFSFQGSNYSHFNKSTESANVTSHETFSIEYISESIIDEILEDTSYENSSIDSTQEADDNYYIIQNTSNISEDSASFSLGIFYKRKLLK